MDYQSHGITTLEPRSRIDYDNGRRCVEKFDKKLNNGAVSLVLGSGIFVNAVGDVVKNMEDVRKFVELMDFEAIEAKVR